MRCFRIALLCGVLMSGAGAAVAADYNPTIDDWVGVNTAVDDYMLGLELHDQARFDRAFWPDAVVIAEPVPGISFKMPYKQAGEFGPPPANMKKIPGLPGGGRNAAGGMNPPWHLTLNHHFEFQDATHATNYGYFISVYPDLKTKLTVVGLPGHYADLLEKRNGEWRIIQRTTVIGVK